MISRESFSDMHWEKALRATLSMMLSTHFCVREMMLSEWGTAGRERFLISQNRLIHSILINGQKAARVITPDMTASVTATTLRFRFTHMAVTARPERITS